MSQTEQQARDTVANLVERFRSHFESYRSSGYRETEVRVEYIDPFFEALGWDVHNKLGYAEPYKDVVHEESLRSAAGIEAPDYTFRIGGTRKFFVEAKKPAVNVKADAGPAYQLRRYAWSGKLPLSILTDFEELAVYDCTRRPAPTDAAGIGRTHYLTCDQYPERWPDIWSLFAKDSVLRGSLDSYVRGSKRGTNPVDREILKEIEAWREELARNLALRNPQLSVDELNQAVQLTIDRILFLRVAEDRGSEEYGLLLALLNGANVYPRLAELYRLADQKYNAGLFNLKADRLTPTLTLDDKVLKDIINGLYYPESPYEFTMIAGDILGQVYEQFLGKVIRLTAGHRAVVEEKPEVKKAGGVYYTPTYIVDYIVEHTVGELIKGQTPDQISKLRVLDPACGSGSFLLGAYQHLLD
ncbi:MAG TPA: N-6 DNA methylase, partial [Anaerolineae bacterium]|nr:N-6 DNA methylase [Anaerolineae bacterium]